MADLSEYVTLAEAAAILGVSKSRAEQYVRDGRLTVAAAVGGLRVVRRSGLAAVKAAVKPPGRPKADPAHKPAHKPGKGRRKPRT